MESGYTYLDIKPRVMMNGENFDSLFCTEFLTKTPFDDCYREIDNAQLCLIILYTTFINYMRHIFFR